MADGSRWCASHELNTAINILIYSRRLSGEAAMHFVELR